MNWANEGSIMKSKAQLRPTLPERILDMSEEEQIAGIIEEKKRLGESLIILGHHYQRESIVEVSDFRGDSFALSAKAVSQKNARYIVFCGVHFMAESARILAAPEQRVFHPNLTAGCPMADMAAVEDVEIAWREVGGVVGEDNLVPVTYMNSSADIKAFCGARGGAVCTSSNAQKVFRWVIDAGKRVLFLPDEHLGRNTANALEISKERFAVWNPKMNGGGLSRDAIAGSQVIAWKGFCHVHTHFTVEHIDEMRSKYPGATIIVHPECPAEVVAAADGNGSTGFIVNSVKDAPAGAVIIIGTEVNLITRLAHEYPGKTVLPLARSLCHNMYKINPGVLLYTLENLDGNGDGECFNEILVDAAIARDAKKALEKMLALA
jgi:quinolinate synthase